MAAPSAKNMQPWEFVVTTDKEKILQMSKTHNGAKVLEGATVCITICGNYERCDTDIGQEYWIQDCSAATENILLAISALGLGACWIACHPRPERIEVVRSVLGLPEHIQPLCNIAAGYPDDEKEARTKYNDSYVHYNGWK